MKHLRITSIESAAKELRQELKLGAETPEAVVEMAAIKAMKYGYDDAKDFFSIDSKD